MFPSLNLVGARLRLRRAPMYAPLLFAAGACATIPEAKTPSVPRVMSVSAKIPRLLAASPSNQAQRHGGVSITLTPSTFDIAEVPGCSYQPAKMGLIVSTPDGVTLASHSKLTEARYSDLKVEPQSLTFMLTIKNGMSRVFRGAGAVVQFKADERIQNVEHSGYVDFINALIPPGGESQIRIAGPALAALADSAKLTVSLYDIVSEIDNAGNVTKRSNYEWMFSVQQERITRNATITSRNVWAPNRETRRIMARTAEGGIRMISTRVCLSELIDG